MMPAWPAPRPARDAALFEAPVGFLCQRGSDPFLFIRHACPDYSVGTVLSPMRTRTGPEAHGGAALIPWDASAETNHEPS